MLKIYLEEEYGFRHWVWSYSGTKKQLIADWQAGRYPTSSYFYGIGKSKSMQNFSGSVKRITLDEVVVHHLNPKYSALWVRGTGKMREEERSKIFNAPEYKALQDEYKKELNEKWPIRGHIFAEDDTYLIIDDKRYIPYNKK
jgi:hypothetical protein